MIPPLLKEFDAAGISRSNVTILVARGSHGEPHAENPIWLYRTGNHSDVLPSPVRDIRTVSNWSQILEIIRKEQGGRNNLSVVVYPCAPLQILERIERSPLRASPKSRIPMVER